MSKVYVVVRFESDGSNASVLRVFEHYCAASEYYRQLKESRNGDYTFYYRVEEVEYNREF